MRTCADGDGFTEIAKSPVSKVPMELAKHEAAQHRVSREMKRKRDADDQG
jgi:ATP-dependent RNA helicase DDX23/PRP28